MVASTLHRAVRTDRCFCGMQGRAGLIRKYHGHTHRINCVTFNEEASVLASASYDRTVQTLGHEGGE